MSSRRVGTAELKARLSEHLQAVRRGDTVVVLDRREPVARIVPMSDSAGGLVIRPPTLPLHAVVLPDVPNANGDNVDIVDTLENERAERLP